MEKRVSLLDLAKSDFKVKKVGTETYRVYCCPICGGKDHFTINSKENYYNSFTGCCKGGSVYKYLQEVKGMSEDSAYKELCRLAGNTKSEAKLTPLKEMKKTIPPSDSSLSSDNTSKVLELYNKQTHTDKEYFINRGLSNEIIDKYKLCIADIKELNPKAYGKRVIIPIWKDGQVTFYNSRALIEGQKPKYMKASGDATFFNIDYLKTAGKDEIIIVCEGEFDSLSFETIGIKAIGIGGTENYKNFLEHNNRKDIIILTAFDNDKAGQNHKGEYYIKIPKRYKDANEWLQADKSDFKESINKQILEVREEIKKQKEKLLEEYKSMTAASFIENFKNGINASANTQAIPTGFKELDNMLDDGLYEGLYILGAIPSIGKTSWLLQLCDQIAEKGQDILYFSLEMSKAELIAKSISRLTYLNARNKSDAKTTRGILSGKCYISYSIFEKDLIDYCIKQYQKYADHLYISEGFGDIGVKEIYEAVNKHIETTGNKPVVVIDYLQILAPFDMKASDKQNTDKAVLELKRLSRDYKIPVVAISSFNRDNYLKEVSMIAFKESGAVEYSSDVLIGLQFKNQGEKDFDVDAEKAKEKREVEVKILKNRNGPTGGTIEFDYYCLFNYFINPEMKDKSDKNVAKNKR